MAGPGERLIDKTAETIRRYAMFRRDAVVLVAFSGGADSMALLHVLRELGYRVGLAHLDHGTRDGQSACDATFVRELAETQGLPLCVEHASLEHEAQALGRSFEEYAREKRYAFLRTAAERLNCDVIATGHHAGDQAETVLMRLLRGTSPQGLRGVPPVRRWQGMPIVRPLLACRRAEILDYLAARDYTWREDESNQDSTFLRNRIRHDLIPQLERDYNPELAAALGRLARIQYEEDSYLRIQTTEALTECLRDNGMIVRETFASLHRALQSRVLVELVYGRGRPCSGDLIEGAISFVEEGATGQCYDVGGGLLLHNARMLTEIVEQHDESHKDTDEVVVRVDIAQGSSVLVNAWGRQYRFERVTPPRLDTIRNLCGPERQYLDAQALGDVLVLRGRRPGDRFAPLGMNGHKKLKDYYTELGLTLAGRQRQTLIVGACGIAWVVGHTISREAALSPASVDAIKVEVWDAIE